MESLATTLTKIREAGDAKRPPELTAVMKRATRDLAESGITERIVGMGQKAPRFARPRLDGNTVRLSAALRNGPVILSFFRGRW